MAIITEDEVRKVYANASPRIKTFIDSTELENTFDSIRKTHNLHLDQAGNLAMLIDAVILEMQPLSSFPALLKDALVSADDATVAAVLHEVNEKVFTLFREYMKAASVAPAAAPATSPAAPEARPLSVVEQKVASVSMPEPVVQKVTPPAPAQPAAAAKPATPPTYHGTDPYREPAE